MKFWTAFIVLFFMTGALQAQVPYQYLQPYYPGAYAQPYYPQAYYPQAYYPQPYGLQTYLQDRYAADQVAISNDNSTIDGLTRQVQQLTEEVRLLQSELTAAQANVQRVSEMPPPLTEPATPVVLVLKNGKRLEAQGYAAAGDTLWILTPSGSERIALSNLNVPATQSENLKRGVRFPNP